jgi:hypothetical protein
VEGVVVAVVAAVPPIVLITTSGGVSAVNMCKGDSIGRGGGGNSSGKAGDVINAALKEKNLSKCLHKFFGPGTILTNANLPRIDASQDLPGVGQTDARQVPDTGRATIQIDRGTFSSLAANDPFLVGTYLHETANALAIQRFTNIQPRSARARRGPLGGPPSPAQAGAFDKDMGNQFEDCIRNQQTI